jgi:hypothetical protein
MNGKSYDLYKIKNQFSGWLSSNGKEYLRNQSWIDCIDKNAKSEGVYFDPFNDLPDEMFDRQNPSSKVTYKEHFYIPNDEDWFVVKNDLSSKLIYTNEYGNLLTENELIKKSLDENELQWRNVKNMWNVEMLALLIPPFTVIPIIALLFTIVLGLKYLITDKILNYQKDSTNQEMLKLEQDNKKYKPHNIIANTIGRAINSCIYLNVQALICCDGNFGDEYNLHKDNIVKLNRLVEYLRNKNLINGNEFNAKNMYQCLVNSDIIKNEYIDIIDLINAEITEKERKRVNFEYLANGDRQIESKIINTKNDNPENVNSEKNSKEENLNDNPENVNSEKNSKEENLNDNPEGQSHKYSKRVVSAISNNPIKQNTNLINNETKSLYPKGFEKYAKRGNDYRNNVYSVQPLNPGSQKILKNKWNTSINFYKPER